MNDEKEKNEASEESSPQSGATTHDPKEKALPLPISSNPIVISAASFPPPSAAENVPPSTIIQNAMMRGKAPLPLSMIVGIGCAIFVIVIGLTLLLLFR